MSLKSDDRPSIAKLYLESTAPIAFDPGSHAFFQHNEEGWIAKQVIDPDPKNQIVLDSGEQFGWVIKFGKIEAGVETYQNEPSSRADQSKERTDKNTIILDPLRPAAWNAVSIPAWHGDKLVSYSVIFSNNDVD